MNTDDINTIFNHRHGYCTLKELKARKVHTSHIKELIENGTIEKIKPGLYRLASYDGDESASFVEACLAIKTGVVCMHSALSYYDLTTQNPQVIHIAVPNNYSTPIKMEYPPIRYHYFSKSTYALGIETVATKQGVFRIYDREKTICDCFRSVQNFEEGVSIEALKDYLKLKSKDINKLVEYAKVCRVRKTLTEYLKVLMA